MGKLLIRNTKINENKAILYAAEILLALDELHKKGVIFRDLKPENVLFDEDGHALLTDFGLSKQGIGSEEFTKSFCGSTAYLAPEILEGKPYNKAIDWYLFGAFIYEMFVGFPPYYSSDR